MNKTTKILAGITAGVVVLLVNKQASKKHKPLDSKEMKVINLDAHDIRMSKELSHKLFEAVLNAKNNHVGQGKTIEFNREGSQKGFISANIGGN